MTRLTVSFLCLVAAIAVVNGYTRTLICGNPAFNPVYTSGTHDIKLTFNRTTGSSIPAPGFSLLITSFNDDAYCDFDEFKCSNGHCISRTLMCDGYNNCGDGTDERSCLTSTTARARTSSTRGSGRGGHVCPSTQFTCSNGNCIRSSYKCDGDNDCLDYSDEVNCYSYSYSYTNSLSGSAVAGIVIGCLLLGIILIAASISGYRRRYRVPVPVLVAPQCGPNVMAVSTIVPPPQTMPPPYSVSPPQYALSQCNKACAN